MSRIAEPAETVSSSSWDGDPPEISVLVPTHSRAGFLPDLVGALERQRLERHRFEVVIVDDASTDETWDVLRSTTAQTPLRMLAARAGVNAGAGVSRNLAASLARAPLFAFTDDDCTPAAGWLETLRAGLLDADVVQGRTLPRPDQQRRAGAWSRSLWITEPSRLFETCNIGWRREAFSSLGGFHTAWRAAGTGRPLGEDVELGWRLVAAGGTTAFRADALVHHRVYPGTYAEWLAERRRLVHFPTIVRRSPGMRRALKLGVFLSRDTATFDLALAGVATAATLRRPWLAAFALPWLRSCWRAARHQPGRPRPVRAAQLAIGDVVGLSALLAGSVKSGRLVL